MFCPKCASQNIEGASFCRGCGANISLVPQALSGELPAPDDRSRRRHRKREPSLDQGIRSLMMGIAFIIVSILVAKYSPAGELWWYWLLIPASGMLGGGIAGIVRAKRFASAMQSAPPPPQISAAGFQGLPAPKTGELMPAVPSVTEGTTRHLGAEAPTRHL